MSTPRVCYGNQASYESKDVLKLISKILHPVLLLGYVSSASLHYPEAIEFIHSLPHSLFAHVPLTLTCRQDQGSRPKFRGCPFSTSGLFLTDILSTTTFIPQPTHLASSQGLQDILDLNLKTCPSRDSTMATLRYGSRRRTTPTCSTHTSWGCTRRGSRPVSLRGGIKVSCRYSLSIHESTS